MIAVTRQRLIIAGAGALAILCPVLFTWPARYDLPSPPDTVVAPMPRMDVNTTGHALQKPLFAPDRRPLDINATKAPAEIAETSPPQLVGIARHGAIAIALLRTSKGETVSLRPGEDTDSWVLAEIERDAVTLTHNGQPQRIAMDFANKPAATQTSSQSADAILPPPPAGARP